MKFHVKLWTDRAQDRDTSVKNPGHRPWSGGSQERDAGSGSAFIMETLFIYKNEDPLSSSPTLLASSV